MCGSGLVVALCHCHPVIYPVGVLLHRLAHFVAVLRRVQPPVRLPTGWFVFLHRDRIEQSSWHPCPGITGLCHHLGCSQLMSETMTAADLAAALMPSLFYIANISDFLDLLEYILRWGYSADYVLAISRRPT